MVGVTGIFQHESVGEYTQQYAKAAKEPDRRNMVACFPFCARRNATFRSRGNRAVFGVRPLLEWDNGQEEGCVVRPGFACYRRIANFGSFCWGRDRAFASALEALAQNQLAIKAVALKILRFMLLLAPLTLLPLLPLPARWVATPPRILTLRRSRLRGGQS